MGCKPRSKKICEVVGIYSCKMVEVCYKICKESDDNTNLENKTDEPGCETVCSKEPQCKTEDSMNCHEKVETECFEENVEECQNVPERKCKSRNKIVCEDLIKILCN